MKISKMILLVVLILNVFAVGVLADGEIYSFELNGFQYEFGHGAILDEYPVADNASLCIKGYMGSKVVDGATLNGFPEGLYVKDIMEAVELDPYTNWDVHKDEYVPVSMERSLRFLTVYDPNTEVKVKAILADGAAKSLDFPDQAPILANDRTMLPIRSVAEFYGWTVNWDGAAQKVTITGDSTEIEITIGESTMWKKTAEKAQLISLDVPAFILNGRTLLPVRAVSEAMGITVDWDGADRCVILK